MSNENPLANINWQTIISSFDDPITLLQWLKKIVEEQGTQTISALNIETVEAGKVKFVIVMDNGDTIESDNFTYVTPSALITAIASCLSSAKDYTDEKVSTKTTVSGTNDGTNWLTITIDGVTYAIPAGGGGGGAAWGQITGTLSNQTDLQNALNGKLDKQTSVTTYNQVYVKLADGSQVCLDVTNRPVPSTFVYRDGYGRARFEAPSDDKDAANKQYVDGRVSGTNDGTNWTAITIGANTYAIPSGGGGGTQLYRHNILISDSANRVTFQIISSSNTAYTNATLVNYFGTSASKKICASGANYSNSRVKTAYQVSGSDATHISIYVIFDSDGSVDTDEIDVLYSKLTVVDTVEVLV